MTNFLNEEFDEEDVLKECLSDVQKVVQLEIFEGSLSKFEKLLHLPKKMSSKKCVTTENHWWGFEYRYHHNYRKVAHRILINNIDKNFDNAFSYYCKLVPVRYQANFLKYFGVYRYKIVQEYLVDEEGNIQLNENYPKPRKKIKRFRSWNAEYKEFDILSGRSKDSYPYYIFWSFNKHKKPIFEKRLVKGVEKEFETKNCKEYKKLRAEDIKDKRKFDRKAKLKKSKVDWNKLMSGFEANKKAAEKNRVDIERLGFDEKTSFTQK